MATKISSFVSILLVNSSEHSVIPCRVTIETYASNAAYICTFPLLGGAERNRIFSKTGHATHASDGAI